MIVQFGTDGKRINSTKIPSTPVSIDCVLKTPCSVESPILELSTFVPQYSTAYIAQFGRYYFVTNIECVTNNVFRYYLTVDPLASHKNKILANTLYVERSQDHYSNYLSDEMATHLEDEPGAFSVEFAFSNIITNAIDSGVYILQTVAPGVSESVGASTCTYAVTASTLWSLVTQIFDTTFYGNGVMDEEVKFYFDPFKYIISCQWVPLDGNTLISSTALDKIRFGWWESSFKGTPITTPNIICQSSIILPASIDWTDHSPAWHRMDLYIPGCGTIEVDPAYTGETLTCNLNLDVLTGNCIAELVTTDGALVSTISGQLGISIQLSQLYSDPTNFVSNILGNATINGMTPLQASEDLISGAMPGVVSNYASLWNLIPGIGGQFNAAMKNALQPQMATCGTNGNMSYLRNHLKAKLTTRKYSIYETNLETTMGKPCRRNYQLSALSGFTKCQNANVEVAGATASEKKAIKHLLEGGVFIE